MASEQSGTSVHEIQAFLGQFRRRLRLWSILDGLARFLLAFSLVLLTSLAVDYAADRWFDLGPPARTLLSLLWGGVLLGLAGRLLVARFLAWPSDQALALHLEARDPSLSDRLISAVELGTTPHGYSTSLLAESARRAASRLQRVNVSSLLALRPLLLHWSGALAAVLLIVAGGVLAPLVARVWMERVLLLQSSIYPRQTAMIFAGDETAPIKVARGRDVEVNIDVTEATVVPERAWLWSRSEEGVLRSTAMTLVGQRRFRALLSNVILPVEIRAAGGDGRTAWRQVMPVEPPRLVSARVKIQPPAYTGLPESEAPISGSAIPVPDGAGVTLEIVANKELVQAEVATPEGTTPCTLLEKKTYRWQGVMDRSVQLRLQVVDDDGLSLDEPFPVDLAHVADQPPRVTAQPTGVSGAVTATALIPMRFDAQDDYGLGKIELEVEVDTNEPKREPIEVAELHKEVEGRTEFPVESHSLAVGQKLALKIAAADRDDRNGPNESSSETFRFEIVTAEELMARLSEREVAFRERLEQLIVELREGREALVDASQLTSDPSEEAQTAQRLGLDRVTTIVRKNQAELASLGEGVVGILDELTNNRIGDITLTDRLRKSILDPMRRTIDGTFPRAAEALQPLHQGETTPEAFHHAEASLAAVIADCENLLAAMLKLESFQEVVSLLQTIVDEQEKLNEATRNKRKEKLLDVIRE